MLEKDIQDLKLVARSDREAASEARYQGDSAFLHERINRMFDKLDAHIEFEDRLVESFADRLDKQDTLIELLEKKTATTDLLLERYKGAVGMLAVIGSFIVGAVAVLHDWVIKHITLS